VWLERCSWFRETNTWGMVAIAGADAWASPSYVISQSHMAADQAMLSYADCDQLLALASLASNTVFRRSRRTSGSPELKGAKC